MTRFSWLVLVLAAAASPATADECQFAWSPAFHDTVVVPRLKTVLKDKWADWDDPNPAVRITGQMVRLQFKNIHPDKADAAVFVVRSENCGKGPVFAGLIPQSIEID